MLANRFNTTLNQVMLRIKNPATTIPFFTEHFGMTVIDELHFGPGRGDFSLFFLVTLPEGAPAPAAPGSPEAAAYRRSGAYGCCLELTHNHGTENEEGPVHHNGNSDPRGFGHVGFLVDDLDAFCADIEAKGVAFQKRPTEGRMRDIAFALTPDDNYWVEVVQRSVVEPARPPSFQQVMIRVKDGPAAVAWYNKFCHFEVVAEKHFGPEAGDFSLYFMADAAQVAAAQARLGGGALPDPASPEAFVMTKDWPGTLLELTHNHGTENDAAFAHVSGNEPTKEEGRGFGHLAIMVDDVFAACEDYESAGAAFQKTPLGGRMKGLAFLLDEDRYWVEVVGRTTPELAAARQFAPIKAARPFPRDVALSYIPVDQEACSGPQSITTGELLAGKKALLICVPGAFTPGCSQRHLPGLVEQSAALRASGYDLLACVSTGDAFLMHAWGRAQNVAGSVDYMLGDGNGELQRQLGTVLDLHAHQMGARGQRWLIAVEDGVTTHVFLGNDAYLDVAVPQLAAPQAASAPADMAAAAAAAAALAEAEAVPAREPAQAGEALPAVAVKHIPLSGEACDGPQEATLTELFAGKHVLLVAIPGVFTPDCTDAHLPGFIEAAAQLKADKGVDEIAFISGTDAFAMHAWASPRNAPGAIDYALGDGSLRLAKALGLTLDLSAHGMGLRTNRFCLAVRDNVIEHVFMGAESFAGEVVSRL